MTKMTNKEDIDKKLEENTMNLLYFGNTTCGVCVDLKPKIKDMLEKYPQIEFMEVDVNQSVKLAADFSIFTIPVVIVYAEGKEVIREARYLSVADIDSRIERYYSMLFD